ncbi:MAG: hypothetical protein M1812_006440 [Candelaria pacifica]|nr:MAG: hypothetical protein M1812_006440 [Candelaria pacifica]
MSSLTLKISSLVVRTVSKPIANYIKSQAREHERFRKICVRFAQSLHRIDMRMRLGLLRESNTSDKHPSKESDTEHSSASRHETVERGSVKRVENNSEAEKERQSIERVESKDKKTSQKAKDSKDSKDSRSKSVRIRPLSEAKAIDTGANFISETFLFLVGGSLILFESWRSRRKENIRREDVAERLEKLEALDNARDVAHEKEIGTLQREIATLKAKNSNVEGNTKSDNSLEKTVSPKTAENVPRKGSPGIQADESLRRSSSLRQAGSRQTSGDTKDMDSSRRTTTHT